MAEPRTAFVFPGLNGAGHAAEQLPLQALPGFVERWQLVSRAFGARAGFAAFAQALHAGRELPVGAPTWPWRALAVTAMQLAMAEELERHGERADWLCSYSIGDVARSCHAGVVSFAEVVGFAADLPPLPAADGRTVAMTCASPLRADALHRRITGLGLGCSRLSPRFLLVAGADPALARMVAELGEPGVHMQEIGPCALHAPEQRPLAAALATALASRRLRPPQRAVFSTLAGRPLRATDDLRAEFAANVARPCDFANAVRRLHEDHGVTRFVDLGPGRHAQRFVRHHGAPLTALGAAELLPLTAARA